jgi:protein-tyrosine phosphatase
MSSYVRLFVITTLISVPVFAGRVPGIKNFDQVDAHVYRGAQPTDEGFRYLAKIGVATVLDLQEADGRSRAEEKVVRAAGMKYVNVPMTGLTPPTEAQIARILDLLEDSTGGPVFVHCHRGADRTGAVVAAYRIDYSKWENGRALAEAEAHDMSFFQLPRKSFIRSFRPRMVQAAEKPASGAALTGAIATAIPVK